MPPVFQSIYNTPNPAAFVFVLATFGAFGVFFAPIWMPALMTLWRRNRLLVIAVLALSLLAAAIPATTYDYAGGRRSGIWNLVPKFPTIAAHASLLMLGLAFLGAATLTGLFSAAPLRPRLVLLAAVAGFAAACTANHDLFQRYMDPLVLIVLPLLAGLAAGPGPARPRMIAAGPITLAALALASTVHFVTNRPQHMSDPPPLASDKGLTPVDMPRPPMPPGKRFW